MVRLIEFMGRQTVRALSALEIGRLTSSGLHYVGGVTGLAVRVAKSPPNLLVGISNAKPSSKSTVARSWILRVTISGHRTDVGLGGLGKLTLAAARERAFALHALIAQGINPVVQRKAEKAKAAALRASSLTFKVAAERYIAAKSSEWKGDKHRQQWENTIATYCEPILGMFVGDIEQTHVLEVLEPQWLEKNETLSRLRGRIENILDFAMQRGYRPRGDNPARWRGHLDTVLGNPSKVQKRTSKNHAALPYVKVGAFVAELRAQAGQAAQCLEFTILTACRTGESIGARWEEFDEEATVWNIPASRMKSGNPHRVPLSPRAQEVIRMVRKRAVGNFVFPGRDIEKPMSNMAMLECLRRMKRTDITVHGFRSTFRDWCADIASAPREIAEACLAHSNGNETESSYLRSDHLEG